MMRHTLFLILVLIVRLHAVRADDKTGEPDFSVYPQTEAFKDYLGFNRNPENVVCSPPQVGPLLAISAFPRRTGSAIQYVVYENGQERDWRWVHNLAYEAEHEKQLSEASLASLEAAIHELPAKSVTPPILRLVVISFRDGAKWVTRSYDSQALPKAMRQIYDLIGERFESKQP